MTPTSLYLLRRLECLNRAHQRKLITDLELTQELTYLWPLILILVVSVYENVKEVYRDHHHRQPQRRRG